jgi:DnaJ-class molecular chaperone
METKTLSVDITPGVTDNTDITFFGEGHLSENSLPGDLIVKIKIQPD